MDANQLRELAKEHLLPLFSGAGLDPNPVRSTPRDACVALRDLCTIEFKVARTDDYRLQLRRSQPFDKLRSKRVTEKHVVDAFISVVSEIEPGLSTTYRTDLLSTFQRRVVAHAIAPIHARATLLAALDQLAAWATRLYEGRPIAGAIGFVPDGTGSDATLAQIGEKDFSSVLSNGFDTLLAFDFQGRLIGHEALPKPFPFTPHSPSSAPQPVLAPSFAPYRQGPIAAWARTGRIALALNRLGEILVIKDSRLLFARRSGRWHFLTHGPVLTQMGQESRYVRRYVYESCLDASFARSGACVGIVAKRRLHKWKEVVPFEDDHLENPKSVKSKTVARLLNGVPFQNLDRRLRQELLAIDGATVLDYEGRVLAVGAILKIEGGSTGGGRLAAAKALSALGVGIKVSQDGGIEGYVGQSKKANFRIMSPPDKETSDGLH